MDSDRDSSVGESDVVPEELTFHPSPVTSTFGRHSTRRPKRHARNSSLGLSTDTFSLLPEYQRTPAVTPPLVPFSTTATTAQLHWDDKLQPPPTYPGPDTTTSRSAADTAEETHAPTPRRKLSRSRRKRSYSDSSGSDDALDLLLKRSVAALETSNALLQASFSTNSNLSALLADNTFDRTIDAQLKFLERRLNASQVQTDGMDEVLNLLRPDEDPPSRDYTGGMSRSLPSEMGDRMDSFHQHQHLRQRVGRIKNQRRLQLSSEARPISPPPRPITQYVDSYASESTSNLNSMTLPPTLGLRSHSRVCVLESPLSSPQQAPNITSSTPRRPPPLAPSTSSRSPSALKLLSSIHSQATSPNREKTHPASPAIMGSSSSPLIPKSYRKEPNDNNKPINALRLFSPDALENNSPVPGVSPLLATWLDDVESAESPTLSSPINANQPIDLTSPPPTSFQTEYPTNQVAGPGMTKTVESLRKIMNADTIASASSSSPPAQPTLSDVARGKQRADGERRDRSLRKSPSKQLLPKTPGFQPLTRASLSPALAYHVQPTFTLTPSEEPEGVLELPQPIVCPVSDDKTASCSTCKPPRLRVPPPRSALKTASTRASSPASSGRSTPRVSFASLPPKHQGSSDGGSVRRLPIKKDKRRRSRASTGSIVEERGWFTQWLLGPAMEEGGRGRPRSSLSTSYTASRGMMREEGGVGRWGREGGLDSWQV